MPIFINRVEYVTISEAGAIAGRSLDTIRRAIRDGLIEAHQDRGRRWLILTSSLTDYLLETPDSDAGGPSA